MLVFFLFVCFLFWFVCFFSVLNPKILHEGTGTFIWIFKIFSFSNLKNRSTYRCLTPIFFQSKIYLSKLQIRFYKETKTREDRDWKSFARSLSRPLIVLDWKQNHLLKTFLKNIESSIWKIIFISYFLYLYIYSTNVRNRARFRRHGAFVWIWALDKSYAIHNLLKILCYSKWGKFRSKIL